jgi:hypothetical protein
VRLLSTDNTLRMHSSTHAIACSSDPSRRWNECRYVPRALMLDLEPNVIDTCRTKLYGGLFKPDNFVKGITGAGNNWAKGFLTEGNEIIEQALDVSFSAALRRPARLPPTLPRMRLHPGGARRSAGVKWRRATHCKASRSRTRWVVSCLLTTPSDSGIVPSIFAAEPRASETISGGTGAGTGTLLLTKLRDEYPDSMMVRASTQGAAVGWSIQLYLSSPLVRITGAGACMRAFKEMIGWWQISYPVFPSAKVSEVVVEPYNAMLAIQKLMVRTGYHHGAIVTFTCGWFPCG